MLSWAHFIRRTSRRSLSPIIIILACGKRDADLEMERLCNALHIGGPYNGDLFPRFVSLLHVYLMTPRELPTTVEITGQRETRSLPEVPRQHRSL